MEAGTRAYVYCRVSTNEQGISGLGLDAQEQSARTYCAHREWVIVDVCREVASGSKRARRPMLEEAIGKLCRGEVLVVAKGDRLARSLSAYVRLIERAHAEGWAIVAADGSVDLTTPHGRAMAGMAAVFAELEADLIGDRTKVALEAARKRGRQLGRKPAPLPDGLAERVTQLRREGASLRSIAATLNESNVPNVAGGNGWHAASVKRVLDRRSA